MNISIITVGKRSSGQINALCNEYEKRFSSIHRLEWYLVDAAIGRMEVQERRKRESDKIIEQIKSTDYIVLLDEKGAQINNSETAELFQKSQLLNKKIVLVIGGAFGVSQELYDRADYVWSLSKLVFPHEIIRLILVEQLYRTFSIMSGLPYHHE